MSKSGVKGAEEGVKFRSERARWMKLLTWPSRPRLGMPAGNIKLEFSSTAPNATRECRLRNWN
eukprot:5849008-Amphidinium_carterae.1